MSAELWLGKRKPVDTAGAVLARTCGEDTSGGGAVHEDVEVGSVAGGGNMRACL